MSRIQKPVRLILLSVWAVVLTSLTYVLGAPCLRVLQQNLGRWGFWSLMTLLSISLFAGQFKGHAVFFFSLVLLVGVFAEFEEMGFSFTLSALFTIWINFLLVVGGFALWIYFTGPHWSQTALNYVETLFKPLVERYPSVKLNYVEMALQLPSVIICVWFIALYIAILLERRTNPAGAADAMATSVPTRPSLRPQLATFRLPDIWIWLFILSLLGAFGGFQHKLVESIAVNLMNVCALLLFFQGIAVVSWVFTNFRMSLFWQIPTMTIIIVQLGPAVILIGLLDYWINFRNRLAKRAEIKRET